MQNPNDYLSNLKNKLTRHQEQGPVPPSEVSCNEKFQPEQLEQRVMLSGSQCGEVIPDPAYCPPVDVADIPADDVLRVLGPEILDRDYDFAAQQSGNDGAAKFDSASRGQSVDEVQPLKRSDNPLVGNGGNTSGNFNPSSSDYGTRNLGPEPASVFRAAPIENVTPAQNFAPIENIAEPTTPEPQAPAAPTFDNEIEGTDRDDDIDGTNLNEIIRGGGGIDHLHGQAGNDLVIGGDGNDIVEGNLGNDEVQGGRGDDQIFGGSGDDILRGGEGNDRLVGGGGDELLNGGFLPEGTGHDQIIGGEGFDTAVFEGDRAEFSVIDLGSANFQVSNANGSADVSQVEQFEFNDTSLSASELAREGTPQIIGETVPAQSGPTPEFSDSNPIVDERVKDPAGLNVDSTDLVASIASAYGYNADGFDVNGFNVDGFDHRGFDARGFDLNGFDRFGFGIDGFSAKGFDVHGYDINGFDVNGFDANGFDNCGLNAQGFDVHGFNEAGFDARGFDAHGFNAQGRDANGFDAHGFDADGYNVKGVDVHGFNRQGFDSQGFDVHGFNPLGINAQGFDVWGNQSSSSTPY